MKTAAVTTKATPKAAPPIQGVVQLKLAMNVPGDRYEEEANAMAEWVMRHRPRPSGVLAGAPLPPLSAVGAGQGGIDVPTRLAKELSNQRSEGTPLPERTRRFMEDAFSTSFAQVRIHTNEQAAQLSRSIGARAFTHGHDLYFDHGLFAPDQPGGQRLLAHELSHVVQQQGAAGSRFLQRDIPAPATATTATTTDTGATSSSHNITLTWRNSVLNTIFLGLRTYNLFAANRLNDAQFRQAIEEEMMDWEYRRTYIVDGADVTNKHMTLVEFERLMAQYPPPPDQNIFTIYNADSLLTRMGITTWAEYEDIKNNLIPRLGSVQELIDVLSDSLPMSMAPRPQVRFPTDASDLDRQHIEEFLRAMIGPDPASSQTTPDGRPGDLWISEADLEAVRAFYRLSEGERRARLNTVRRSGRATPAGSRPPSVADMLETLEANVNIAQYRTMTDYEARGGTSDQRPIVNRPVRGHIAPSQTVITEGMEAIFQFEITDQVDAFRVPHIYVRWSTVSDRTNTVIGSERCNYIEVREQGLLNDRLYEQEFSRAGSYTVHALVYHNFYLPNAFTLNVQVITPTADLEAMQAEAGALGTLGTFQSKNFDMGLSDIGSYDEGFRAEGTLSEDSFEQSITSGHVPSSTALARQITDLETLRDFYLSQPGDHSTTLEWANSRITHLQETKARVDVFGLNGQQHPIVIQAIFSSRRAGVRGGVLNMVAYYRRLPPELAIMWGLSYEGFIFDHSEIAETGNMTFRAVGQTYDQLIENLFVEVSKEYPNGMMQMSMQVYDEHDQPTHRMITYRRMTDTLGGDIHDVAFSMPAQIIVNTVAAILTVFPATTPLGIGISLAYNGAQAGYDLAHAAATDTLRWSNAVDVGMLMLDLIPVIGPAAHEVTTGTRIIRVVALSGQAYTMTDAAVRQIDALRTQRGQELMQAYRNYNTLQQQHAPAATLRAEYERLTRLEDEVRRAAADALAELATTQGLMLAVQHGVGTLAQGAREHLDIRAERAAHVAVGTMANTLPEHLSVGGELIARTENSNLPPNETRVHYTTDAEGLITDIRIEHGTNARLSDIQVHTRTVALLQRFQGFSGRVRLALQRVRAILTRYTGLTGSAQFPPGSRAFDAHMELEKIPRAIAEQTARLTNPSLPERDRIDAEAQLSRLEGQFDYYHDILNHLDNELLAQRGVGYVAATGSFNEAARVAGYPPPPADHYYERTQDGQFQLRRREDSTLPAMRIRHDESGAISFEAVPTATDRPRTTTPTPPIPQPAATVRMPPGWDAGDATRPAVLTYVLRKFTEQRIDPEQGSRMLLALQRQGGGNSVNLLAAFNRVMAERGRNRLPAHDRVLSELANPTSPQSLAGAFFLLERMDANQTPKVSALLTHLDLASVQHLRDAFPALSPADFMTNLAPLAERVQATSGELAALVNRAGYPPPAAGATNPDWARLQEILRHVEPADGPLSAQQAGTAIDAANEARQRISATALPTAIATTDADRILAGRTTQAQLTGGVESLFDQRFSLSRTDMPAFIDAIVGQHTAPGVPLNRDFNASMEAVVRPMITDFVNNLPAAAHLTPEQRQNIINTVAGHVVGDLFEHVNHRALQAQFPTGQVRGQVLFSRPGTRADNVVVNGDTVIIYEYKTGGSGLRTGQSRMEQLIGQYGNTPRRLADELSIANDSSGLLATIRTARTVQFVPIRN